MRNRDHLSDDWRRRLRAHLKRASGEDRDHLTAQDFRSDQAVVLRFDDGSFAMFRYAFALFDETGQRCMVFTEHCGYHEFVIATHCVDVVRAAQFSQNTNG